MSCRVEVPRMLYATQQMGQLETYIRGSGDRELLRWWARYCESTGVCGCGTGGAVGICLDGWGRKGSDGLAGEHASDFVVLQEHRFVLQPSRYCPLTECGS